MFIVAEVMPVNFEGAKLMVNKGISNHFQVTSLVIRSYYTSFL